MIEKKLKNLLKMLAKKIINYGRSLFKENHSSKLINTGDERNLYLTNFNDLFWLKKGTSIDDCIINNGIFEEASTKIVKKFIKNGDIVFDIGANIGYYSVIFSKIVGPNGQIFSFEPTKYFSDVLKDNLAANNIKNVELIPLGLSDKKEQLTIQIDGCSATLHVPGGGELLNQEIISLITLDIFVKERNISQIDFVKIDVDGHEPAVLNGGWKIFDFFKPLILLEISHAHYLQYGTNAWDFYKLLKDKGLFIYYENTLEELNNLNIFLSKCGNFNHSANILLSYKKLEISQDNSMLLNHRKKNASLINKMKYKIKKILKYFKRQLIITKIHKYKTIDGWLAPLEAVGLYTFAKKVPKNGVVVEIGSWKGKSTYCLAKGVKPGVKIIAIDPFDYSGDPESEVLYKKSKNDINPLTEFTKNMEKLGVTKKIEIKKGLSKDFINQIKEIDLLFIDGDHSIEGCIYDYENYSPKIKPGGYLLFHDYNPGGKDVGPTWVIEKLVIPSKKYQKVDTYDSVCVFKKY